MEMFEWRALRDSDLDAVLAIAAKAHPSLPERREVFAEKLRLYPAGCRCLAAEQGKGAVAGYFFSHPWYAEQIPQLDSFLEQIPPLTDTYYLHDLALNEEARRGGHGGSVVRYAQSLAFRKGYTKEALVAVNESQEYWRRHGFEWAQRPCLEDSLRPYGAGARYMLRLSAAV